MKSFRFAFTLVTTAALLASPRAMADMTPGVSPGMTPASAPGPTPAPKPAKKLPAYKLTKKKTKKKKIVKIDFESKAENGTHATTIDGRLPLPLAEAERDQSAAVQAARLPRKLPQKAHLSAEQNQASISEPEVVVGPQLTDQLNTQVHTRKTLDVTYETSVPAPISVRPVFNETESTARFNEPVEAMTLPVLAAPTPAPVTLLPRPTPQPTPQPTPVAIALTAPMGPTSAPTLAPSPSPEPSPSPSPESTPAEQVVKTEPAENPEHLRLLVRFAYLAAPYDQLEGDLENGATAMALGLAKTFDSIEARGLLEVGDGLDQAVTPQNTRYLILRGDATYLFMKENFVTPTAGLGAGFGSFNVFSVRSNDGTNLVIRENDDTSAFLLTPAVGVRFKTPNGWTVDLNEEYYLLLGGSNPSALGGWNTAVTLGIPF